jgi:LysR family transcriptional regulator, regulator for bpeEF and oprC
MAGFQTLAAFAETARRGSFAAAARELGLSPSAVAKSVARLEQDFGLRLFHRTTRQVTLTVDGHELFARCERILDEMDALRDDAAGARAEPSGTLRMSTSITLGKRVVMPLLAQLIQRHPLLRIEMRLSDRFVDLIGERLDCAIRIGPLADSSLVARKIGQMALPFAASPDFLAQHGTPRSPEAALALPWIMFRNPTSGRLRPIEFANTEPAHPQPAMVLDDGEAMVEAAAQGLGLIQVPLHMLEDALAQGRLVELLKRHRPPLLPVSLVHAAGRHVPPRLAALAAAFERAGPLAV